MEQQLTEHSRSELAGRLALALSLTNDLLNRTTLEFHGMYAYGRCVCFSTLDSRLAAVAQDGVMYGAAAIFGS